MASEEASAEDSPKVDTSGQITVPLEGQEYVLRPSYEAIIAIERELGLSLQGMVEKATYQRLTIDEMAVMVAEMMRAHGKARPEDALASSYRGAKAEGVKPLIFETSTARVAARLVPLLVGALTGGYTAEGEAKPATN